jgi:anaerobic carbon-monoxide dehydrogenase iron sulfur subunit
MREENSMSRFIAVEHQHCTGCRTCELLCSLYHFGECNPAKSAIRVIRRERDGLVFCLPLVCQRCRPAPCIDACTTRAISRDATDATSFNRDDCTRCELCLEACPVGAIAFTTDQSLLNCNLCGGEPQCVPACHASCLSVVEDEGRAEQNADHLAGILEREDLMGRVTGRRS